MGGKRVRRWDTVFIPLGAINRDPAQFPEPDKLNITRSDNKHLAFGYGIHFCMGAPMARLEAQIAFGALAKRYPNLALVDNRFEWRETVTLRGLRMLMVKF